MCWQGEAIQRRTRCYFFVEGKKGAAALSNPDEWCKMPSLNQYEGHLSAAEAWSHSNGASSAAPPSPQLSSSHVFWKQKGFQSRPGASGTARRQIGCLPAAERRPRYLQAGGLAPPKRMWLLLSLSPDTGDSATIHHCCCGFNTSGPSHLRAAYYCSHKKTTSDRGAAAAETWRLITADKEDMKLITQQRWKGENMYVKRVNLHTHTLMDI